jgi:hypothetical protein
MFIDVIPSGAKSEFLDYGLVSASRQIVADQVEVP